MKIRLTYVVTLVLLNVLVSSPSQAATYAIEEGLAGRITYYRVKQGDTLYHIARSYDLGIVEVMGANPGVDPWMPEVGQKITLPTVHIMPPLHKGILINLSELRLYYFLSPGKVMIFPIGVGKEGWVTPLGTTRIVKKRVNPIWVPPDSIRREKPDLPFFVEAGPDNPMGQYALNLGWPGYAIHGTNQPYGVGKRSSHGCIRMYPEDIAILFNLVNVNTPVKVINTPYKIGRYKKHLILETAPDPEQADEIASHGSIQTEIGIAGLEEAILETAYPGAISWYAVELAVRKRRGIPFIISKP